VRQQLQKAGAGGLGRAQQPLPSGFGGVVDSLAARAPAAAAQASAADPVAAAAAAGHGVLALLQTGLQRLQVRAACCRGILIVCCSALYRQPSVLGCMLQMLRNLPAVLR